jgi:hypothetical protein
MNELHYELSRQSLIDLIKKRLHCLEYKKILEIALDIGVINQYEYDIYVRIHKEHDEQDTMDR